MADSPQNKEPRAPGSSGTPYGLPPQSPLPYGLPIPDTKYPPPTSDQVQRRWRITEAEWLITTILGRLERPDRLAVMDRIFQVVR